MEPSEILEDARKKDTIFIPIMTKISIPFNLEEQKIENKRMREKDLKAKKHLEEMCDITRNLSYNDIKLLKKYDNKGKKVNRTENIEKDEQREIQ